VKDITVFLNYVYVGIIHRIVISYAFTSMVTIKWLV